jgi:hypothetical protein
MMKIFIIQTKSFGILYTLEKVINIENVSCAHAWSSRAHRYILNLNCSMLIELYLDFFEPSHITSLMTFEERWNDSYVKNVTSLYEHWTNQI